MQVDIFVRGVYNNIDECLIAHSISAHHYEGRESNHNRRRKINSSSSFLEIIKRKIENAVKILDLLS